MESKLKTSLNLKFEPVAVLLTDQKPEPALQFAKARWGCVMQMLAAAAKGKTSVFDRETYGCMGGAVGLGFGSMYEKWPGGINCFYNFLSIGNAPGMGEDQARQLAEKLANRTSKEGLQNFLYGERYVKSPELVKKFVDSLPIIDIEQKYVAFKPLKDIDPLKDRPEVIVLLPNPEQLSALVVLYNYETEGNTMENVIVPGGAGCQQIGIIAFREARSERPRAVVGLTDLSARNEIKKSLGRDILAFTIPFRMFMRMENNAEGSFLSMHTWRELTGQ